MVIGKRIHKMRSLHSLRCKEAYRQYLAACRMQNLRASTQLQLVPRLRFR